MLLIVRSFIFTSLLFLSVVPYALVALLVIPLSGNAGLAIARAWARFNFRMLKFFCRLDYRVEGRENIPTQPCVAYWKHSSAWETLAMLLVFPGPQSWVLKRELLWIPIFGWALFVLRPIAINRRAGRSAVKQVLHQGLHKLRAGRWIMIFPEGTRMPAGTTRRYGMSGSLLAVKAHVPIVPVAHDAGYFWPRRGLRKRPGTITVRIGAPIASTDRTPEQINQIAQEWIEREVNAMVTKDEAGAT